MKRPTRSTAIALPAATLGALAASSASAAIVYSGSVDVSVLATGSIYFDLEQLGATPADNVGTTSFASADFGLSMQAGANKPVIATLGGNAYMATTGGTASGLPIVPNSPLGTQIESLDFLAGPGVLSGFLGGWNSNGTPGYVGLKLGSNYGWAQISYAPDINSANYGFTLHDFAYANAGEAITAGQTAIPEPSTYAALTGLLAGSAVLYARRRKRAA